MRTGLFDFEEDQNIVNIDETLECNDDNYARYCGKKCIFFL